ncbi:MAG: hypothetical protein A2784_03380 [Candidatus Chisholmbacteria bacterium RIFCSPHIGHO2_01_FULL_48_12]|uniref:HicB-like antitoxin of toxin-antitoxin system domain-containing protein n=1 Tax=Candidatus Chisholmbacteria bacterium RIFCSPHIGHO2_01_FULL_48_12 TaxID=1797589 RepID=A0A1G1VK92_9BACT|nr:MAG: hypothetical protein A2784_03380 [Candidatus Chisholmbacteria bacterium RIFCSPHIGHO2_01_FULL_48_12]
MAKAKTAKILQFRVVIEQDENGWYVASVPDLAGCYTQGKTLEQVRQRIREAIELVLESEKNVVDTSISPCPRFFGIEDITIYA